MPIRLSDIELTPIAGLAGLVRLPFADLSARLALAHAEADPATMFMRLFYLLQALGQYELARDMQARALERQVLFRLEGSGTPAIRLLALMASGDMLDNTPVEYLVEHSDIRLDLWYLLPNREPPETLPDHDVLIVAIGESDRHRALLERAAVLLKDWPRPVLNAPQRIGGCARDAVFRRLADLPGLLVPETRRLTAAEVRRCALPLTIRPPDTHAGVELARIDGTDALNEYLACHPSAAYFVASYVEYRSADGQYRKYRIALIDGRPFICHLAIADHWIVHYIPSGMHLSAAKRDEERAAMDDFDHGFARRHAAALRSIAERLALDHVVLDCAELTDGRLLLFEADSRAWVHATDPLEIFPYKPVVMQKAFDAFRALLLRRIAAG